MAPGLTSSQSHLPEGLKADTFVVTEEHSYLVLFLNLTLTLQSVFAHDCDNAMSIGMMIMTSEEM